MDQIVLLDQLLNGASLGPVSLDSYSAFPVEQEVLHSSQAERTPESITCLNNTCRNVLPILGIVFGHDKFTTIFSHFPLKKMTEIWM